MKKMNLLAMSLVSAAALSFSSCSSNDDLAGGGTQSQADGVYMTLSIAGSNQSTRTEGTVTNPGIEGESTITEGTLYLYSNKTHECVFRKVITSSMFEEPNKTKPIKISVNSVNTKDTYTVYFMANKTGIKDPLATDASFTISEKGGAEYGLTDNSQIVMFNQNDHSRQANHSIVRFTAANNVSTNPATAGIVYLDRVVARIDEPTVTATNITSAEGNTKNTENVAKTIAGIEYEKYAISNVNNNSYIVQKWSPDFSTLSVKWGDTETTKYFQPTSFFGDAKAPANLDKFGNVEHNYVFENTTTDASEATALYFQIKANLTTEAATNADFADGTFYRYDKKLYTRIADIFKDAEKGIVSNPFTESGETTAADVVESIKDASDNLISDEGEGGLNEFRNKYKIEVFRAGSMYYYYPIQDNTYMKERAYSVLRNSIYQLTVTKISEVGKDIPNGPTPDENNPNYYMTVQVQVNPWILNTENIELK
ncbi:Mfa1 family fimbria major subunit [Segatella copri]|uniref:Mfa1 family fimbria major subunit n=1 Tax=Segatella copri TaxID=165179 RepID=UPI003F8C257D